MPSKNHRTYEKQVFFIERFVQNTPHFDRCGTAVHYSYFNDDILRKSGQIYTCYLKALMALLPYSLTSLPEHLKTEVVKNALLKFPRLELYTRKVIIKRSGTTITM